jgi:hypothetical protein
MNSTKSGVCSRTVCPKEPFVYLIIPKIPLVNLILVSTFTDYIYTGFWYDTDLGMSYSMERI